MAIAGRLDLMEILSKSVAKINKMETINQEKKRKSTNKVFPVVDEIATQTASIVYKYILSVSPEVASLFREINPDLETNSYISLVEVVKHWEMTKHKSSAETLNAKTRTVAGTSHNRKCNRTKKSFTPREDYIIQQRIDEEGPNINIVEIANELGRTHGSIYNRIRKLKGGCTGARTHKVFSLEEDEIIMNKVLGNIHKKKLSELVLPVDTSLHDLAVTLGRPTNALSLANRWTYYLQPWILQYYAKSLNLDIRQMLANHVSETYESRESIDWDAISKIPDFAGHTAGSLGYIYANIVRVRHEVITSERSLQEIADSFNEYMRHNRSKRVPEQTLVRQKKVIQYFEDYVKKHNITNFL